MMSYNNDLIIVARQSCLQTDEIHWSDKTERKQHFGRISAPTWDNVIYMEIRDTKPKCSNTWGSVYQIKVSGCEAVWVYSRGRYDFIMIHSCIMRSLLRHSCVNVFHSLRYPCVTPHLSPDQEYALYGSFLNTEGRQTHFGSKFMHKIHELQPHDSSANIQ